jgi:hypothetical protein
MPNLLYNNSIAIKLLVEKVGEFWWETRLWLKLIIGHCTSNHRQILNHPSISRHCFQTLPIDITPLFSHPLSLPSTPKIIQTHVVLVLTNPPHLHCHPRHSCVDALSHPAIIKMS